MIGDHDPEDAFDRADPPDVLLGVLERVVTDLRRPDDGRREARRLDALRLAHMLRRVRKVDHARLARIRRALETL